MVPDIESYLARLKAWVSMQSSLLRMIGDVKSRINQMDRLELVLYSRMAFQNIINTAKAFDNWLQDMLILAVMPEEELRKILKESIEALEKLLILDVSHTDKIRSILEDMSEKGILPDFVQLALARRSEEGKERTRGTLTM